MRFKDKVDFLKKPSSYPQHTENVQVKETHTAVIFLTDDRVYKMKKPVRLQHLDITELKDRERLCREEYRLNSQLAADFYLGVLPLNIRDDGRFVLDGRGTTVEWLVEMKRLPEAQLLDNRISRGTVKQDDIRKLGDHLVQFYRKQRSNPVSNRKYPELLVRESRINHEHLLAMLPELEYPAIPYVLEAGLRQLRDHIPEIDSRISQGLVVEGHGDLRPEHICLLSPPVIFDRLEFNTDLLIIDIYDEVNYLGLECARIGASWIGKQLLAHLKKYIGSPPTPGLLTAYGVFRLLLRARLAIDHLRDPNPRTPEKWPLQSRYYVHAAAGALNLETNHIGPAR